MQKNKSLLRLLIAFLALLTTSTFAKKTSPQRSPRVTVVMIVDQFAYHYIPKLRRHMRYGLNELLSKGVFYTNAYHAHGIPETTPGHHALSTGTLPKDHGAILNQWFDREYKKVAYACDPSPDAAILNQVPGQKPCSISSRKTRVDGLSDQFILSGNSKQINKVFALSLKSYPALATANRLGKALWFDDVTGNFTSSKAYFTQLPSWVTEFNKRSKLSKLTHTTWDLQYPATHAAYNFHDAKNYDYCALPFSMITRRHIPIDRTTAAPYDLFVKTPQASAELLNLAKYCIDQNLTEASDRLLVWICLSNLDLLTHLYGPDSLETTDLIYHLDKQIGDFMGSIQRRVGEKNCLFVLAADHGICPIPEIAKKQGLGLAKRIMAKQLTTDLNALIEKKYGLVGVIKAYEPTFFVFNHELLAAQPEQLKKDIINDLKAKLIQTEGIKAAWAADELANSTFQPDQLEQFYKTQLFKTRSGDLYCMPEPYCQITYYPTGTSHMSPYEYDTHIPLVLYQKSYLQKKVIEQKVWAPQLPVTLAHLLHVKRPAASIYQVLPGIDSN